MQAVVEVQEPDKINLTLTVTFPLSEWRLLSEQLADYKLAYWPYRGFAAVIKNAIQKADIRLTESASVSNT